MPKKYKMITFSKPVKGREKEYNDWYQNVHIKDVTSVKSFVGAQRFELVMNIVPGSNDLPHYLAIYDIETDDIGRVMQGLGELAASGRAKMSDAMDNSSIIGAVYEESGLAVKS